MMYLRNFDKPGFIGALGGVLGGLGLNIATFHLGRKEAGGEAIALIEVDGNVKQTPFRRYGHSRKSCGQTICALIVRRFF